MDKTVTIQYNGWEDPVAKIRECSRDLLLGEKRSVVQSRIDSEHYLCQWWWLRFYHNTWLGTVTRRCHVKELIPSSFRNFGTNFLLPSLLFRFW
jgi:hypothetical protein